ncbi:MAG TPA: DnaB-like helicase C-terminal domain-containing protein [Actinomycetota bacterium]|nr:DnaB-like helicase C-terminal domain-containing protein [Actinomycetota bacterium]
MLNIGEEWDDENYLDAEQVYLAACCEHKVWDPTSHGLDRSLFNGNAKAFDLVDQYVTDAGEPPPVELLVTKFPGFERVTGVDPRWAAGEVIKAATARIMLLGLHDATELVASGNVGDASQLLLDIPGRLPCNEGKDGTEVTEQHLFEPISKDGYIPVPDATLQGLTGGIGPGQFWVIAARLKQGKTWELARYAISACKAGWEVVFISLEMTKHQIAERFHALILGSWHEPSEPAQRREAVSAWFTQHGSKLVLLDRTDHPMLSPATVGTYCRPNRLVIVDYISLMSPSGKSSDSGWETMQGISRELRRVTLASGGSLLTAAQLNREGNKKPDLIHVAETDSIARDADVVMILQRKSDAAATEHTLAANRHGSAGDRWWTNFNPTVLDFKPITHHQYSNAVSAKEGQ